MSPPKPKHARSGLGGKPEARGKPEVKLRLYIGGNVEAKLDVVPFLHAPLMGRG
jgi:hypothetical protein